MPRFHHRSAARAPLPLLLAALTAGCAGPGAAPSGDSPRPAAAAAGDRVVAVVAGTPIHRTELEESVAGELLQVARERQQILEDGLGEVVRERLLALEVAARGTTREELIDSELAAASAPPSDADVDAFYVQNQARIQLPKEQVADRIRQFLVERRRQAALEALFASLEERYGVETFLDPLRVPVAADGFPSSGPADAPVTLVEFSDFECPYCSQVTPAIERVRQSYGERVRVVFRHYPLISIHPNAFKAAEASLCAHEQDRFWAMHDALFADARNLAVDQLKRKAADLGLDAEAFDACLDSGRQAAAVSADIKAGRDLGVNGTPAIFINGRLLSGAQSFEALAAVIDEELARAGGA